MKSMTRVALVGALLGGTVGAEATWVAAAPAVNTSYYACQTGATISAISVVPHACARGSKVVSGKFAGANFTGANFTGANLTGAALKGSTLTRIISGKFVGTPSSFPSGFTAVAQYLVGPTVNLTGANLANQNLSHVSLSSAILTGANLTNTTMVGTVLTGAQLGAAIVANVSGSQLVGVPASLPAGWKVSAQYLLGPTANLANQDLTGINAVGASLASANLSGATLASATVSGVSFAHANLSTITSSGLVGLPSALPAGWIVAKGNLVGPSAVLSGVDLSNTDLRATSLRNTNFYGVDLTNANLSGVDLTNASISMTTVAGSQFAGANLTGVVTNYLTGTPASMPTNWFALSGPYEGSTIEYFVGPSADISGAQLSGVSFAGLILSSIFMPSAHLTGADFTNVVAHNANLASASLGTAEFAGSDFSGTDFTQADFSGADFSGANFTNANFTGARFLSVLAKGSANFTGAICPDGVKYGVPGANC